jgi:hypothetical protein
MIHSFCPYSFFDIKNWRKPGYGHFTRSATFLKTSPSSNAVLPLLYFRHFFTDIVDVQVYGLTLRICATSHNPNTANLNLPDYPIQFFLLSRQRERMQVIIITKFTEGKKFFACQSEVTIGRACVQTIEFKKVFCYRACVYIIIL